MPSPLREVHESLWIIPTEEFLKLVDQPDQTQCILLKLAVVSLTQRTDINEEGQLGYFVFRTTEYDTYQHCWTLEGIVLLPAESWTSPFRLEWSTDPTIATGLLQIFWISDSAEARRKKRIRKRG